MAKGEGYIYDETLDKAYLAYLMEQALVVLGGGVLLDDNRHIVYMNRIYMKEMGLGPEAIGKPIEEVLPFTEMSRVYETAKAERGVLFHHGQKSYLINRVPIRRDGRVLGVVGMSMATNDLERSQLKHKLGMLTRELNYYKEKYQRLSSPQYGLDSIVTKNRAMLELKETLSHIAQTKSTVLLTGESGTGKEVFAQAIHNLSPRRNKPFVRLNCAAIPDQLLEAELFGYEEGAFTGAAKGGKIGDFQAANGGTLLLDEVDALSPALQTKLLRAIQEKQIKKVGSTATVDIDVRFIFATNKDLMEQVQKGQFREDFYYRINVINLKLPPLRERMEDLPELVTHFIKKLNADLDMAVTGVTPEAMALLQAHSWPGNIRELENAMERAFNYAWKGELAPAHFQLGNKKSPRTPGSLSLRQVREEAEAEAIRRALIAAGNNKKEAAVLLGIDRSILYDKLKRYGLS